MHNDQKSKSRRRAVAWSVVVLLLLALLFAGMHLLSVVNLSSLHGG